MRAWRVREAPRLAEALQPHRFELFDTASQGLVDGDPTSDTARMYVCGLTPYDATHMGHANTYITFDLLHRVWLDRGFGVDYVQNVTDIDDPLLERANATGVDWRQLAEEQTQLFREDMAALNVLSPTHYIGAVEAIPLISDLIKQLREQGAVYAVADAQYPDLYFDVNTDAGFGSLGHLSPEQAKATFAERGGDPDRPGKRDPLDCLVWRMARPDEPSWETTLGTGRPGWHIECTAIAIDRLGTAFDVQGGGSDLIFPHHEMCAAEARVASGHDFARVYVHAGMVGLDGEKMSKSKGNLVLVSRLRECGTDPMAIRLALLANRYRSDWSWTPGLLEAAEGRLDRWRAAVGRDVGFGGEEVVAQIRAALANDLDAPTALAAVDAWVGTSSGGAGNDVTAPALVARACDALLGIKL